MSLSDKIVEILRKEPMLGISGVHVRLKTRYGIDKSKRTVERHFGKLVDERKVTVAGYDRKKRQPLYIVWDKGANYNSIMDCPEINEVDWSKVPPRLPPALAWFWKQGEDSPWLRDMIRLDLRRFSKTGNIPDSWSKNFLKKLKDALKSEGKR